MNELIASYLVLYGECPLDGIGKLSISKSNAVADLASKEILSPQFNIHFKETKNVDMEEVVKYISRTEGCREDEASDKLKSWLDEVKARLSHHIDFEIPFIGTFVKENNGHVQLKPLNSLNVLQAVHAERVVHIADSHEMVVGDKLSNTTEMNQLLRGGEKRVSDKWWVPAVIIFSVAILIIIIYFLTNGFGMHLHPGNAPATYNLK